MLEITILVGLVLGLTQIAKGLKVSHAWLPLIAVILGVLINLGAKFIGGENIELVLGGIMAGLMSSGLWDLGSDTLGKAILKGK